MSRTPKKPPLALDMDFSEALTRFAKTDPKDVKTSAVLDKKRKKRTRCFLDCYTKGEKIAFLLVPKREQSKKVQNFL